MESKHKSFFLPSFLPHLTSCYLFKNAHPSTLVAVCTHECLSYLSCEHRVAIIFISSPCTLHLHLNHLTLAGVNKCIQMMVVMIIFCFIASNPIKNHPNKITQGTQRQKMRSA